MKLWIIAVAVFVTGLLAGWASSWVDFSLTGDNFLLGRQDAGAGALSTAMEEDAHRHDPKVVVVDGERYEFGSMAVGGRMTHTFVIKNDGFSPLKLEEGETSCKCTMMGFQRNEEGEPSSVMVPPKMTTEIQLEWVGKTEEPDFEQVAEILTNDPRRPAIRLIVSGAVVQVLQPVPEVVTFSNVSSNEPFTADVRLFSTRSDELEILSHTFTDQETAHHFDLSVGAMGEEDLRLYPAAKAGLTLSITLKPGLPSGGVVQNLRLRTNYADAPDFDIPIAAQVISDVSVLGDRRFNRSANSLHFGAVDSSRGDRADLLVLVKGPHRQAVQVSLTKVDPPDALQVQLGEPRSKTGKVITYPLRVQVAKGAPPMVRMGSEGNEAGQIVIETTHPSEKQLKLHVQFTVID